MTKPPSAHDVVYEYSAQWTRRLESQPHWNLYWQQLSLMEPFLQPGAELLELGVGSGFTANYLRSKGFRVTTVDIDADKKPDICARVDDFESDRDYDALLAFEVFEHMPYEVFERALSRLAPHVRTQLFLSVPYNARRTLLDFKIQAPIIGTKSLRLLLPVRRPHSAHHFWELDDGKVTVSSVASTVSRATGLELQTQREFSRRHYFAFVRRA